MKRIISLTFTLGLVLLSVFALGSCGETLETPSGFYLDGDTLELTWNRVEGAKTYRVVIDGPEQDEQTLRATKLSLQYLSAGSYEIKIMAKGNEVEKSKSEFATFLFERPLETGLKYQLINGNTEYELVGGGTASGDVVMESVYRGKPVTSIADKALYNNGKITSLVVSENVKSIGEKAFAKASALTSVIVPEGVVSLGDYAFQSCKALVKVTLPNSIDCIPPYSFSWCSALTDLKIGNRVTVISDYAFSNCTSLPEIKLPATLTELGECAFSDCQSLKTAVFGENLKRIGNSAFRSCETLENITLYDGISYVGEQAFAYCKAFTEIILPNTVTELGAEAFLGCSALNKADIGDSVISLGHSVFSDTLLYENAEDVFCVNGWLIDVKNNNISAVVLPNEVYGIASLAFDECKNLSTLVLDNVRYVGDYAFYNCTNLSIIRFSALETLGAGSFMGCNMLINVMLGDCLKSIDDFAFYGCSKIVEVDLPDTLTSIGTYAFVGTHIYKDTKSGVVYVDDWAVGIIPSFLYTDIFIKDGTRGVADYAFYMQSVLFTIDFGDTVEYIGKGACFGITMVQQISLPNNLKVIGDYAFYGCMTARYGDYGKTEIPRGTEYIGRSAFYENDFVIDLHIPSSVRTIGDYAFYGCDYLGCYATSEAVYLGDLIIENGVESIGNRAFQGCINIDEVVIPDSVKTLGTHAFYKCDRLKKVTLGSGITEIGKYTFYKCPSLEYVTLSGSVKEIGDCAFASCEKLTDFSLQGVESIGGYAFYQCAALSSIGIPETVKSIGEFAFRGCSAVSSVVLSDSIEEIGEHAFYGLTGATLYCAAAEEPDGWDKKFNSSHRPAIFGCTLAEDGTVAYITVSGSSIQNENALNGISNPERVGYTFVGWTADAGGTVAQYTAENLADAPTEIPLYAIWK